MALFSSFLIINPYEIFFIRSHIPKSSFWTRNSECVQVTSSSPSDVNAVLSIIILFENLIKHMSLAQTINK